MSEDDRSWLTDFVAPIILPEEERVFLQLTESAQREGFKEDFWRRREMPGLPLPLGPGYRDRYQDLRKVLDAKFIGWKSDAGRLILRRGVPDSVFKPQCGGEEVFRDLEIWTYSALELKGHAAARHIFYRSSPNSPRRLWMIHDGNAIAFQPNACRASFDQLSRDCGPSREDSCGRCEDRCVVYGAWAEILKRQGSPAGALAEQGELFGYPKISSEGLDRPKARWAMPAISNAKAPGAGNTTPAPTPTSIRQPTLVPTVSFGLPGRAWSPEEAENRATFSLQSDCRRLAVDRAPVTGNLAARNGKTGGKAAWPRGRARWAKYV
jgi:GWxTD domain-containing protein